MQTLRFELDFDGCVWPYMIKFLNDPSGYVIDLDNPLFQDMLNHIHKHNPDKIVIASFSDRQDWGSELSNISSHCSLSSFQVFTTLAQTLINCLVRTGKTCVVVLDQYLLTDSAGEARDPSKPISTHPAGTLWENAMLHLQSSEELYADTTHDIMSLGSYRDTGKALILYLKAHRQHSMAAKDERIIWIAYDDRIEYLAHLVAGYNTKSCNDSLPTDYYIELYQYPASNKNSILAPTLIGSIKGTKMGKIQKNWRELHFQLLRERSFAEIIYQYEKSFILVNPNRTPLMTKLMELLAAANQQIPQMDLIQRTGEGIVQVEVNPDDFFELFKNQIQEKIYDKLENLSSHLISRAEHKAKLMEVIRIFKEREDRRPTYQITIPPPQQNPAASIKHVASVINTRQDGAVKISINYLNSVQSDIEPFFTGFSPHNEDTSSFICTEWIKAMIQLGIIDLESRITNVNPQETPGNIGLFKRAIQKKESVPKDYRDKRVFQFPDLIFYAITIDPSLERVYQTLLELILNPLLINLTSRRKLNDCSAIKETTVPKLSKPSLFGILISFDQHTTALTVKNVSGTQPGTQTFEVCYFNSKNEVPKFVYDALKEKQRQREIPKNALCAYIKTNADTNMTRLYMHAFLQNVVLQRLNTSRIPPEKIQLELIHHYPVPSA